MFSSAGFQPHSLLAYKRTKGKGLSFQKKPSWLHSNETFLKCYNCWNIGATQCKGHPALCQCGWNTHRYSSELLWQVEFYLIVPRVISSLKGAVITDLLLPLETLRSHSLHLSCECFHWFSQSCCFRWVQLLNPRPVGLWKLTLTEGSVPWR